MIRAGFVTQASKPVPAKTAPKNRMQKSDKKSRGTKRQRDTALTQEGGPKGREHQQIPMQAPEGDAEAKHNAQVQLDQMGLQHTRSG